MKLTGKQLRKMIIESINEAVFNTPHGSFGVDPSKTVKLSSDEYGDYSIQLPGEAPKKIGDDDHVSGELVRLKLKGYTHVETGDSYFMGPQLIEDVIEEFDGFEGKYKGFYPKSSPFFEPINDTPASTPAPPTNPGSRHVPDFDIDRPISESVKESIIDENAEMLANQFAGLGDNKSVITSVFELAVTLGHAEAGTLDISDIYAYGDGITVGFVASPALSHAMSQRISGFASGPDYVSRGMDYVMYSTNPRVSVR